MNKLASFEERLQLGNDKEYYVNDILNLIGIKSEMNNLEDKTDMDLYLPLNNIYMDVKYLETSFDATSYNENLTADKNLIISKNHIKRYELKKEDTGKDTWIVFLINFEDQNVFELRFIKTEDIWNLVQQEKAIVRPIMQNNTKKMIINLNKEDCLTTLEFIDYLRKASC